MELFDRAFIEKLAGKYEAKRFSKPAIVFLATNTRAEKERQRVEEWFNVIPEKSKANIKGRLRSKDDTQHFSALNELVVDRFLLVNGLEREFEPEVEEGEPDFLVKTSMSFYIEVASVFELEDIVREQKKINTLLDELNKIEHYFFLSITHAIIPDNVKYQDIKKFVSNWMDSFDPDTFSGIRETNYSKDGLELELMISPKNSKRKDPIVGMCMFPLVWVSADHVARAIEKKVQKYKSIKEKGFPYVVAIALEDENLDLDDIISVLYGKEIAWLDTHKRQVVGSGRDNSGLFTSSQEDGLIQNRRLSAVFTIRKKWSEDGLRLHNFAIFHNPFADNPLLDNIFSKYAQFMQATGWTKSPNQYELL